MRPKHHLIALFIFFKFTIDAVYSHSSLKKFELLRRSKVPHFPARGVYSANGSRPVVKLSTGSVEGSHIISENGNKAFGFFGVPYAEPPVGDLRFANPVSRQSWNGTLKCHDYGVMCWSNTTGHPKTDNPGEDCLTLNIIVPRDTTNSNTKYPVIYYIHGGGNDYDFPAMFPPEVLVDNFVSVGVVFVIVGYRLGALGFWSTGTADASGNYALKDMILGLQWVQNEITFFGGDPSRVTIMGHSSGASNVDILSVSPLTNGLFNQVIIMSGVGTTAYAATEDVSHYERLAAMLGCSKKNQWDTGQYKSILQCMRRQDPGRITTAYAELVGSGKAMTLPRIDGRGGVIPKRVDILAKSRRPVNTVTGTTSHEQPVDFTDASEQHVIDLCMNLAQLDQLGQWAKSKLVGSACRWQYANHPVKKMQKHNASWVPDTAFWNKQLSELQADFGFYVPCFNDADTLRKAGATVYLYSFDYRKAGPNSTVTEPFHSFDLRFVMGTHPWNYTKEDYWIRHIYSLLFAQFARYGNPTYRPVNGTIWAPLHGPIGYNYLSVDLTLSNRPFYHFKGVNFWSELVPRLEQVVDQHGGQTLQLSAQDGKTLMLDSLENSNLSIAAIIGISLGSIACISIVAATVFIANRRYKRNRLLMCDEAKPLMHATSMEFYNSM